MKVFSRILRKWGIAHLPLPGLLRVPPEHRSKVFLTFDDGPHHEMTARILDMLAGYRIKATFFVSGFRVVNLPHLVKRIVSEGHLLANHAYEHKGISYLAVEQGFQQVEQCNKVIAPFGGRKIFRPPNGLLSPILYRRLVHAGYRIDFWTLDSFDSKNRSSEEIVAPFLDRDLRGESILFHDDRPNGIAGLEMFLSRTQDRGYQYARLDGEGVASATATTR